ncbi:hypothetical protein VDGL01_07901 [Verticillium dahliae]
MGFSAMTWQIASAVLECDMSTCATPDTLYLPSPTLPNEASDPVMVGSRSSDAHTSPPKREEWFPGHLISSALVPASRPGEH